MACSYKLIGTRFMVTRWMAIVDGEENDGVEFCFSPGHSIIYFCECNGRLRL